MAQVVEHLSSKHKNINWKVIQFPLHKLQQNKTDVDGFLKQKIDKLSI
jgi:hypothetical protein